jgi:hypothetical protein
MSSRGRFATPPISLHTIVARTHMYTYDANVWDLSLVQGPFSVTPCHTLRYDSQLFHRCAQEDVAGAHTLPTERFNPQAPELAQCCSIGFLAGA